MANNLAQPRNPRDSRLSYFTEITKRVSNSFMPILFLIFHYDEATGIHARDQGDIILTPEDWEELKAEIDRFFAATDLQEIYDHNRAIREADEAGRTRTTPSPAVILPPFLERPQQQQQTGWVYLITAPSKQGCKIGATDRRLLKRLKQIACVLREDITCINAFHTSIPFLIETAFHEHFASERLDGEWFDLSLDDQSGAPELFEQFREEIIARLEQQQKALGTDIDRERLLQGGNEGGEE